MDVRSSSLITISEARKHLGKASLELSDSEIEELILDLSMLARKFLVNSKVPKNRQVLNHSHKTESMKS